MVISRGKIRLLSSKIDAIEAALFPGKRIRICVFPGETHSQAAAWYFARRPEHAGAKFIDYEAMTHPRDAFGGLMEEFAGMQPVELEALLKWIDGTSRDLPVVQRPGVGGRRPSSSESGLTYTDNRHT